MRLFIALTMDNEIISSISSVTKELEKHKELLKIVAPNNYHITLKFLGEIDEKKSYAILDDFNSLKKNFSVINYTVCGLGAFPKPANPSIIWIGLNFNDSTIYDVQKYIEDFTAPYGFDKEKRKFQPHLTIARVKKEKKIPIDLINFININKDTIYIKSRFTKIILYESTLMPQGPLYTEKGSMLLNEIRQ